MSSFSVSLQLSTKIRDVPPFQSTLKGLVEEHCDKNLEESLNESLGVLEEGLLEPSDVLAIMSP